MKISKTQLKRIIKEEKSKLLEMNAQAQVDRVLGVYANDALVQTIERSMDELYGGMMVEIIEDGFAEEWEAEDLAAEALLTIVKKVLSLNGHQNANLSLKG